MTDFTGPHMILRPLALAALAFAAALVAAPAARADWTLCNETSFILEAAIAYPEGDKQVTEGWTRLRPSECKVAKRGPLNFGTHHLYARSSPAHRGGLREWAGATPLCVDAGDFSIAGEALCEDVGFETRFFVDIAVLAPNKTTSFTEPSVDGPAVERDPDRTRTAGLQRLLRDNDLGDIRVIDGYAGRRTSRAIQTFISQQGLADAPDDLGLMNLLERSALLRADNVGLKLCNDADERIWTAVAKRRGDTWESRGWWLLAPDQCAKVINEKLDQSAYYVYAAARDDLGDRPLVTGEEAFCLAETRFAILGRDSCEDRGYLRGRFTAVLVQDRPSITLEFEQDDFARPRPSTLRR